MRQMKICLFGVSDYMLYLFITTQKYLKYPNIAIISGL